MQTKNNTKPKIKKKSVKYKEISSENVKKTQYRTRNKDNKTS